jgi:hypothetical protein
LLFYYFGHSYQELFGSRLHIVLGDVTQEFKEFKEFFLRFATKASLRAERKEFRTTVLRGVLTSLSAFRFRMPRWVSTSTA